ncbi:ATPase domain-containing protein [Halobellus sp. H-GB7]|uniref:ATPase domain-containing protein n=1 Tax=Halobellus sp. H-GB7 TaxID=3069756 RepID=UPI0027B2826E|nr:ATPase domain-containing protein [Halobellus sp. H-GB7]MDQ2053542.1 ATPase domain-containing protein [Halobellus sp. H-GB7]
MSGDSSVSSGSQVLDGMLGGGYPTNRSTLLTGGPGSGKSTLSMQFLQAGLDAGEDCLFISTEQTIGELRQSFADFEFDLHHENLSITSIHAGAGRTIEGGEDDLTLQTLTEDEDGEILSQGFNPPFTGEYIRQYLERFAPVDRVVLDSVSGLSVITDSPQRFRRSVLDLIRFFSDEFQATSLFTAERTGDNEATSALRFTTHGVVELTQRNVEDDPHHFLRIAKMRGVDHDRREMEVEFGSAGLRIAPKRRSQPPELKDHRHRPIGIDGLDALAGGGLVRGTGVLLEHDGRANLTALFSVLLKHGLETDDRVVLVPTIELRENRTAQLLDGQGYDIEHVLETGQLAVVDLVGTWNGDQPNVFTPEHDHETVMNLLARLYDDVEGTIYSLVNADAMVHTLGPADARRVRYFEESELLDPDSALCHVLNPNTVEDRIAAFYRDSAEQTLDTWVGDAGLQYIALRKSPCGFVGTTSLVEYVEEPPYVRVQHPPQRRENPYAEANPYAAGDDRTE